MKVLYGVLDWGLGHATRSIPIIRLLRARGCEVRIATSGLAYELLRTEFPELTIYPLPSYAVRYARHGLFMMNIFWQLPRLLLVIVREGRAARNITTEFPADLIISDCRYGFRFRGCKSVFITHQLNFQMPRMLKWLQPVVNLFNHIMINRFDQVWVPDVQHGITGTLSRPGWLTEKVRWIGNLSRLPLPTPGLQQEYEVAVILSGPEPQRTLLENKLVAQLQLLNLRAVVVRGLPTARARERINQIDFHNYLEGAALANLMQQAAVVVARSGYSTVMDLMALGGKAIFIPTPGQTEQELLAKTLTAQRIAWSAPQHHFDLAVALKKLPDYRGFAEWKHPPNLLPVVVDETLNSLS